MLFECTCVVTSEYFMKFMFDNSFFEIQLTLMSYSLATLVSLLNVNAATDPLGTASTNTEKNINY